MLIRTLVAGLLAALPLHAEGERAGDFDYYVMALSWSPNWCATTGDARAAPQCDPARDAGWILHGLWPQYDRGYPSDCRGAPPDPTRAQTAAMADIMGDGGAAWYQWKKHGRCAGLAAADYFALARRAYAAVTRPALFRRLPHPVRLPASVVEAAWLQANPGLAHDGLTVTCTAGRIQEVRICLSRSLAPVRCGPDVVRDCRQSDALMDPVR